MIGICIIHLTTTFFNKKYQEYPKVNVYNILSIDTLRLYVEWKTLLQNPITGQTWSLITGNDNTVEFRTQFWISLNEIAGTWNIIWNWYCTSLGSRMLSWVLSGFGSSGNLSLSLVVAILSSSNDETWALHSIHNTLSN